MVTSAPDYKRAEAEARKVLRENHIVRPPVSPRELAQTYGVRVNLVRLPKELAQVSGYIDFEESMICVNTEDSYSRQTFTIAHEFGHFRLHKNIFENDPSSYKVLLRLPVGTEESDPLEKEANAFAASLLVPMDWLNLYKKYASERDLADLFAVSTEVIRYRLRFANAFA